MEQLCSIPNCGLPRHNIRGWCCKHYQQWRRHGDPQFKDKKSPICSVDGCEGKRRTKGMCNMHYQRFWQYGDPSVVLAPVGLPVSERFWPKVQKGKPDECWMWQAATDKDGYGIFGYEGRSGAKAHRVAYELTHGPIEKNVMVLHHCDTPGCVNPAHLYAGDAYQNMLDKHERGRARYARGEATNHSKLKARQVRHIRHLFEHGMSMRELSRRYGVQTSNIGLIVRHKTWKHVK